VSTQDKRASAPSGVDALTRTDQEQHLFVAQQLRAEIGDQGEASSARANVITSAQPDHPPLSEDRKPDHTQVTSHTPGSILEIYGFGRARVVINKETAKSVRWRGNTLRDLFFYLVCHGPVTRDQLASVFWPDLSPVEIRNRFHTAVYNARGALAPLNDVIVFEDDTYYFNRSLNYTFDVETFEGRLRAANALTTSDPSQAMDLYSQALNLYRGDFMEDYASPNDDWHQMRSNELSEKYLDASERLGDLALRHGRYQTAYRAYKRARDRDSFRESAWRGMMNSLDRLGRRPEALRLFDELQALLEAELDTPASADTEQLYRRIRSGA
jgi:two-component SAPR family response regulator